MKVGDKVSVTIQGSEIAQAEVREVGDGTATLIVPATRVVMAVRTELAPEVTPAVEAGAQTIVDEVVRQGTVTDAPQPSELPLAQPEKAGEAPAGEQNSAQEKVISSSSVPNGSGLSPEMLAQIAAAVVAAQANTVETPAEPAATEES